MKSISICYATVALPFQFETDGMADKVFADMREQLEALQQSGECKCVHFTDDHGEHVVNLLGALAVRMVMVHNFTMMEVGGEQENKFSTAIKSFFRRRSTVS